MELIIHPHREARRIPRTSAPSVEKSISYTRRHFVHATSQELTGITGERGSPPEQNACSVCLSFIICEVGITIDYPSRTTAHAIDTKLSPTWCREHFLEARYFCYFLLVPLSIGTVFYTN